MIHPGIQRQDKGAKQPQPRLSEATMSGHTRGAFSRFPHCSPPASLSAAAPLAQALSVPFCRPFAQHNILGLLGEERLRLVTWQIPHSQPTDSPLPHPARPPPAPGLVSCSLKRLGTDPASARVTCHRGASPRAGLVPRPLPPRRLLSLFRHLRHRAGEKTELSKVSDGKQPLKTI